MKMALRVLIVVFCFGCAVGVSGAQSKSKNDNGAAVAGVYEGTVFIEIIQQELKLKLELIRTHKDSVMAKVVDFLLPTGQKFNYQSQNLSVKAETKNGKKTYRLFISFPYTYNKMPMKVVANGTIVDGQLDSEVKATIMESMQTKVTYKAKKQTGKK